MLNPNWAVDFGWILIGTTPNFCIGADSSSGTRLTAIYHSSRYHCGLGGGSERTTPRHQHDDSIDYRAEPERNGQVTVYRPDGGNRLISRREQLDQVTRS
jgi:hypothetical protein